MTASRVGLFVLVGLLTTGASAQDMPLSQVLLEGEPWKLVSEGHKFTEGPAVNARGELFFTDVPAGKIFHVLPSGEVKLFVETSGKSSGLEFGVDGRLYSCEGAAKQVVAYDADATRHVLAEGVDGNDLVVDRAGGVYVTDMGGRKVWYIPSGGEKRIVTEGFQPNGLTLWGDESTLVVADWENPWLMTLRIVPGSTTLKDGAGYYRPLQLPVKDSKPGSDGMTMDDAGRLYVCTHVGLQVFDPTGRPCGAIAKPQPKFLSNVAFGGEQFDTLYVTCSDKVFSRKTKVTGTPHALWKPAPKTSAK